jgi:hypothetical protein
MDKWFQNWFHNFVEHEGLARTVIVILVMTTVGCLTYTWGYYEVNAVRSPDCAVIGIRI